MIKNKLKTVLTLILTLSIIAMGINTYAHSGRTDSNGGHKDKKNASGLGYYHYHCGGHPPHLHDNGICPYSSNASSATTSKTTKPKTTSSSSSKSTKSRTTSSSKNTKSNTSSSTSSKTTKSNTSTTKKSTTSNSTNTSTKQVVKEETTVAVKDIEINEDIESMEIGESKSLTVTITPSNATDKKVTWKSSDKDIVKVNSSGKITAKEAGTATITATSSNGKTNTIKINVKEEPKQEEKEIAEPITKNDENSNKTIAASSSTVTNNTTETKEEESSGGGIIAILLGYLGYRKFRGR